MGDNMGELKLSQNRLTELCIARELLEHVCWRPIEDRRVHCWYLRQVRDWCIEAIREIEKDEQ